MSLLRITILVIGVSFSALSQNVNHFDESGKRHGIWKKNYDGTKVLRYEGEFAHGKEIGVFKFYKNQNGKAALAITKTFEPDSEKAHVIYYDENGKSISEGYMVGKHNVGEWKYYQKDSNAILTLENYNENGLLHGEQLVYYNNSQIAEKKYYAEGKLEGESQWLAEDGTILKAFTYSKGELHGLSKYYNAKGELLTEGNYKNGKKDGIWKYYEDGNLLKEEDMTEKPQYIKVNGKYKKAQ